MNQNHHRRELTALEGHLAKSLRNRKVQGRIRYLKQIPSESVDFSSNDFLSLATNPEFRQDFLTELHKNDRPVGSMGSRLLDGNSSYAEKLEEDIATFHSAETGLLTNSGFDANVSIFACLPQRHDIIVYDELIHASVHDGMRQSRAEATISFKHNSVMHLEEVLLPYVNLESTRNLFIAVESVYSMDGDLAPLAEIVALTDRMFPGDNCHLIIDEAHSTGVYGPKGRGRVSELGLEDKFFVRLHTFGKALACSGAIILCSEVVKQFLINYARPLIYTTFMPYSSLNAIRTVYDWLMSGRTEPIAQNLLHLITHLHNRLQDLDKHTSAYPGLLKVPAVCPDSAIYALISSHSWELAEYCQNAGFNVRQIAAPTVPEGTERVRVCLHAGNTVDQIDAFVKCIQEWAEQQSTSSESTKALAAPAIKHAASSERTSSVSVDGNMMSALRSKL